MPKFVIDTSTCIDFKLIGINAVMEPYKLAFLLNKYLHTKFKRASKDVDIIVDNTLLFFALYRYEEQKTATKFFFIQNKSYYIHQKSTFVHTLFDDQKWRKGKYLIKYNLKPDFIIKIVDEYQRYQTKKLIHDMSSIPNIISAYEIKPIDKRIAQTLIIE